MGFPRRPGAKSRRVAVDRPEHRVAGGRVGLHSGGIGWSMTGHGLDRAGDRRIDDSAARAMFRAIPRKMSQWTG